MKKIIYQKRYAISGWLGIIIMFSFILWYFVSTETPNNNFSQKEKVWQTIEIKTAKDFASIKIPAKVKSNKFAIIVPRRIGIIQDLLVDIGDEISKGQIIGSMLPEGVEGQSSATIAEASAKLQKARAEISNAKDVAVDSISVATKQWRETNLKSKTQDTLNQETQKQLTEKKYEAVLIATQAWENTKLLLFGTGNNSGSNSIQGNFANVTQKNSVKNLADEIQRMEESEAWNDPEKILEHLSHLEKFLTQTEILYKNAQEGRNLTASKIRNNITTIQNQQIKISQIKQALLVLEEKNKYLTSIQAEKEAEIDRSKEVLSLIQSQQNLTTTQAEKNFQVALANYNIALIKTGHQRITSPFEGVITARMVEVGQAVTPNTILFYLEGANTTRSQESLFEIHFNLPESWRNKVSVGDSVLLKSIEGESFEGQVFRLSSQINLDVNSVLATAIVIDESFSESNDSSIDSNDKNPVIITLQHGQSLFVYITDSNNSIFTVPTSALKKRRNNYFLWKMENKNPVQITVEIVAEDGEFSQIFSRNLTENDFIISNPSVSLFKKSE